MTLLHWIDEERVQDRWDCDEEPAPRRPRGCRGWAAYDGPCGATDCPTCYPGSWDSRDDEEE